MRVIIVIKYDEKTISFTSIQESIFRKQRHLRISLRWKAFSIGRAREFIFCKAFRLNNSHEDVFKFRINCQGMLENPKQFRKLLGHLGCPPVRAYLVERA